MKKEIKKRIETCREKRDNPKSSPEDVFMAKTRLEFLWKLEDTLFAGWLTDHD